MAIEYSKYQKAVFNEIEHGVSNIIIEASAGSAKTTTIIKSLDFIPEDKKILFIAFNTSIVAELKQKIGDRPNITVCTMHSLGRSLIKQYGYSVELKNTKYETFITNNSLFANIKLKMKGKKIYSLIKNINQLISLCRNNMARTDKQIRDVADRYDISIKMGENKIVKEALEWGKTHIDCIDFDDMIWLPNVLNMLPKYVQYDYIFLDEAQDANNAQIEMFLKFRRNGTRMIAVGDKDQSIYNFRGVDGTTFDKLKAMPNTISLPLSISYRCPKKVVEYAQKFSDNIEVWEDAIDGEVNRDVKVENISDNAMVLCRNNAPLVQLYMYLLNNKKKAFISGNEQVIEIIKDLALSSEYKTLERDRHKVGFIPSLYRDLFDLKDKMCSEYHRTESEEFNSKWFASKYDTIRTVEILSKGLTTVDELVKRLDSILESPKDGIRLSSVHKAKGSEADDVYILCDSLMPSRNAIADWEIDEERHIQYVAYTRAKKTLNFIDENDFRDFSESKKDFANRMSRLEETINKLFDRKSNIDASLKYIDEEFAEMIVASTQTALTENTVSVSTNSEQSTPVSYNAPVGRRRKAQKK